MDETTGIDVRLVQRSYECDRQSSDLLASIYRLLTSSRDNRPTRDSEQDVRVQAGAALQEAKS